MIYLQNLPEQRFEMLIYITIAYAVILFFVLLFGYRASKRSEQWQEMKKKADARRDREIQIAANPEPFPVYRASR